MTNYVPDWVFPVIGFRDVERSGNRTTAKISQVFGTAFALSNRLFLTAGHVVEVARDQECWGLKSPVDPEPGLLHSVEIARHEVIPSVDLGVIELSEPMPNVRTYAWSREPAPVIRHVFSLGYPMAWDSVTETIVDRGFTGSIVTRRVGHGLPIAPAFVYELSFMAPRGMSGAPLLLSGAEQIVGMVIGNSITEMEVFRDQEVEQVEGSENKTITTFIKTEAHHYGIAVCADALFDVESDILGTSVRNFLEKNCLFWGAPL